MGTPWDNVKMQHPEFAAKVDMLMSSKVWREECPSRNSWWFKTVDHRYLAQVNWHFHVVKITRLKP